MQQLALSKPQAAYLCTLAVLALEAVDLSLNKRQTGRGSKTYQSDGLYHHYEECKRKSAEGYATYLMINQLTTDTK